VVKVQQQRECPQPGIWGNG